MNNDALLIIDLAKNFDLKEKNQQYIYLNNGNINLINCKQIKLKKFKKLRKEIYKNLIRKFKKYILDNQEKKFFLSEMEIFNLRNDRYLFPDRIINFLIIKKLLLMKKIKKIKVISDNETTLKIFDNLNLKIIKNDLTKFKYKFNFSELKILKFLIKTFFLVFFLKFKRKTKIKFKTKNNFFMSLYPNQFFYGKQNFFYQNENICNFLLSDETHLNFDLKELFFIANITKKKNIINLEEYIEISDILLLFLKRFIYIITFKNLKIKNINFIDSDLRNELEDIYMSSYVNRSKLEIYSKAIPRFLKDNNVSSINLYLFEYSFGFYLLRKIKNYSNRIKIFGFQHGIFSDNLMWLDLINSLQHKKVYFPNEIFCLNEYSLKDYKSKYKNIKISIMKNIKNFKNQDFIKGIKINKKSNKILILAGLHDVKDIYFYVKNKLTFESKKIYYFKLHPKNKFVLDIDRRIKKIENFKNIFFSNVIVSQDSSLHYEFLNSNREFSVIDLDYKQNHISTLLNKNKRITFLK